MDALIINGSGDLVPFAGVDLSGLTNLGLRQARDARAARNDSLTFDPQVGLQSLFHEQSGHNLSRALMGQGRTDSWSGAAGGNLTLSLTQISNEVLGQPMPELQALAEFETDSTMARPGAAFYAMRRKYMTGSAAIHGGGNSVPMASVGQTVSAQRPTKYLVAGASISIFDKLASDFADLSSWRDSMEAANRAIAEKHDDLTWNGSSTYDIWGVLSYPYASVAVSATPISSASSSAAIIDAISSLAFYAKVNSKAVYTPDAVVMSEALFAYLARTYVDTGNASNATLLELVKKACPHITKWWTSWRLDATGPSSTHGMLFYRQGRDGIRIVTPMETVMLPIQTVGYNDQTFLYKQIGGVFEPEAAYQMVCWFTV